MAQKQKPKLPAQPHQNPQSVREQKIKDEIEGKIIVLGMSLRLCNGYTNQVLLPLTYPSSDSDIRFMTITVSGEKMCVYRDVDDNERIIKTCLHALATQACTISTPPVTLDTLGSELLVDCIVDGEFYSLRATRDNVFGDDQILYSYVKDSDAGLVEVDPKDLPYALRNLSGKDTSYAQTFSNAGVDISISSNVVDTGVTDAFNRKITMKELQIDCSLS